jgi:hypothetical protein
VRGIGDAQPERFDEAACGDQFALIVGPRFAAQFHAARAQSKCLFDYVGHEHSPCLQLVHILDHRDVDRSI